jgi:hypothetical protein
VPAFVVSAARGGRFVFLLLDRFASRFHPGETMSGGPAPNRFVCLQFAPLH